MGDRFCRSFQTNNFPLWQQKWDSIVSCRRGCGEGGREMVVGDDTDEQTNPYLQRSSCVESRMFFLFLLFPWWCGLLLWWLLELKEEFCWPWWPLLLLERDILAWKNHIRRQSNNQMLKQDRTVVSNAVRKRVKDWVCPDLQGQPVNGGSLSLA